MEPVSPVLGEEFQDRERVYAKDQPQYKGIIDHCGKGRSGEAEEAAQAGGSAEKEAGGKEVKK